MVGFDWGPVGARQLAAEVTVVVDVLSFSTSVTIAVDRGMQVYPFAWRDERAARFAAERDAVLAVGRRESTTADEGLGAPTLSPAALLGCAPVPRLVLPSPNGSSIAAALGGAGSQVALGCLRNARAVARWLAPIVAAGRPVAVVAAGERWPDDDSLRPALEDQLGAGAILAGLVEMGQGSWLSPEAWAAADLFEASRAELLVRLRDCVSGQELVAMRFGADVEVAAQLDASTVVPVLVEGAFVAAHPPRGPGSIRP